MQAELYQIEKHPSQVSGQDFFYCLILKNPESKYFKTYIYKQYRNYEKWKPVIESGVGTRLDGLEIKVGQLIDADSSIRIISKQQTLEADPPPTPEPKTSYETAKEHIREALRILERT